MSDSYREIWRIGGAGGNPFVVGVRKGRVAIGSAFGQWELDASQCDDFQRAFMEAERQAEAWQAEHAGQP